MIRAIIIDDESYSCDLLEKKLAKHCQQIQVLKSFTSPVLALKELESLEPQLVFLDIQMPVMNGFEWLEKADTKNFEVIFITAYDQYAIKAIRFAALDYLLKPVDVDELKIAVSRYETKVKSTTIYQDFSYLLEQLKHGNSSPNKIALHTAESIDYVETQNIIRCESDGTYTTFFLKNGKQIMVSKNIGEYEELLADQHFFRTHTSHLINLKEVESFVKADGGQVKMKDGSMIDVSRRRKDEFLLAMQKV